MTLENDKATEAATEPEKASEAATEGQRHATDWKAEARKWEQRAKENAKAADELAELRAAQMTEAEKAAAHLAEVESELAALRAEKQRAEDAAEVSKETGVPASLLLYCKSRDDMAAFAAEYGETKGAQNPAPAAPKSRIETGGGKVSAADSFAAYMQNVVSNKRSL